MTTLTMTWWTDRRVRWSVLVAAVLLLTYVELLWIDAFPVGHHHTGDTNNLVAGARSALDCIDQGVWRNCGHDSGSPHTGVFHYPLLQYLPASLAILLGASDAAALGFLARLNVLAFGGCLTLIWLALRQRPRLAALGVVAVLASAATYQSTSAFGEMFAAFVILGAVVSIRARRTLLIVALTALACMAKETVPPFLVVLGLLVGRDEKRLLPSRRLLSAMFAGITLGVLCNFGFNQFRFGTFSNLLLTQPMFRTPGWRLRFEILAGEWFSTVGGLVWFWPIATLVLASCATIGLKRLLLTPRQPLDWIPPIAVTTIGLGYTFGLANWFAPFGWTAYGHRLAVPLLPALLVTALVIAEADLDSALARLGARRFVAGVLLTGAVIISLPQLMAPWTWRAAMGEMGAADADCSVPVYIDRTPDLYYHCLTDTMWAEDLSVLIAAAKGDGASTTARVLGVVTVLSLGATALGIVPTNGRDTSGAVTKGSGDESNVPMSC